MNRMHEVRTDPLSPTILSILFILSNLSTSAPVQANQLRQD